MKRLFPFRAISRARHLKSLWEQRHDIIPMIRDARAGHYRISFWTKLAALATILYVVSPIDMIPDIFPILGWGDDLAIMFFLTRRIAAEIERYKARRGKTLQLVSR